MIIVSQNKKATINFDNVYEIWIGTPSENDNDMYSVEATGELNKTLGCYKTEERALEVKAEIEGAYIDCELIKIPNMDFDEAV